MGKNGPCYHCGVTSTPLWRNGPSEKPVLCNACGSRWRTKGTLTNYTPTHSRPELDHFVVPRATKVKIIPPKKNKQVNMIKRKLNHDNVTVGGMISDYNRGYQKVVEEDTSNRSSSGSAISNPESYTQFGVADASPAQSVEWDTIFPSKKSTCTGRSKASSIEKLTKDLYTILQQQSSHLSGSLEEDLLFESEAPMVSVEIGHGGVLIRHPSSIARDEESEASSLSVDNSILFPKNEGYSRFGTLSVLNESKGGNFHSALVDKNKRPIQQEKMNREKPHHEIIQMLASSDSPLCSIDLKNVLNFEDLIGHFTDEEQRQLVKYLPSVDISGSPDSLKIMFDSDQFKESVSSFQKLLSEGVFNKSLVGVKTEDCKTLKRHVLYNLTKCQWVEHYNLLKKCKDNTQASAYEGPNISTSTKLGNIKRLRDDQNPNIPELRVTKTAKKKANCEDKVSVYNDNSCFSPRSLFRLPSENGSFMLDSYHLEDEASDQDLLLDVPCNNSFPQAELIHEMSDNRS